MKTMGNAKQIQDVVNTARTAPVRITPKLPSRLSQCSPTHLLESLLSCYYVHEKSTSHRGIFLLCNKEHGRLLSLASGGKLNPWSILTMGMLLLSISPLGYPRVFAKSENAQDGCWSSEGATL